MITIIIIINPAAKRRIVPSYNSEAAAAMSAEFITLESRYSHSKSRYLALCPGLCASAAFAPAAAASSSQPVAVERSRPRSDTAKRSDRRYTTWDQLSTAFASAHTSQGMCNVSSFHSACCVRLSLVGPFEDTAALV